MRGATTSRRMGCPISPDFPCSVDGWTNSMRLSLMKAAHAALAGAAYRKSGYLAAFSRVVGNANLNWPLLDDQKMLIRARRFPHLPTKNVVRYGAPHDSLAGQELETVDRSEPPSAPNELRGKQPPQNLSSRPERIEVEGPAVPSIPITNAKVETHTPLCHPEEPTCWGKLTEE